jgi:hypothetical protein
MKIEDVKFLLEEIEPDKEGNGYIDCGTGTELIDYSRYRRIIAVIKQNIALQQENAELTKKLEEVEKQGMESLLQIEEIEKEKKDIFKSYDKFFNGTKELLKDISIKPDNEIRIGDYLFQRRKDSAEVIFKYDPIKEVEPIELKLKITENSDKETKCPICGEPLGKYPAISREDNKTKICSNCGTLEALAAFKESLKDDKTDEKNV